MLILETRCAHNAVVGWSCTLHRGSVAVSAPGLRSAFAAPNKVLRVALVAEETIHARVACACHKDGACRHEIVKAGHPQCKTSRHSA